MQLTDLMSVTGCSSLKELNSKYDFKLLLKKHDGVITEEIGVFDKLQFVENIIFGLVEDGVNPDHLKVKLMEAEE